MIAMLSGLVDQIGEETLVLDVNGVGYLVSASSRTLGRAPKIGQPLKLLIETQLREDRIQLFGFADAAERAWFRLLTTVQGVGGKVALAILSVLDPEAMATAILAQDKAAFVRADGVGRKLGERIVMELRDKVGDMALPAAAGSAAMGQNGAVADAVSGLVNLGYAKSAAYIAVTEAAKRLGGDAKIDALVRAGLQELGR
ncbi:MAG TPA: Holliday junction branch migration protein RuvA [Stellaceae bacterium]|jgi:Holliday junction DNA helicase RuvA|nr:Holliday junction branch migration protein RuvA [Stellaceae bacterium]